MVRPYVYFVSAAAIFAAVSAPVRVARADLPKVILCETLLEDTANERRAFRAGVFLEHPVHIVPVLTPKALKSFGIEPRMLGTNIHVRFKVGAGERVFFEIERAGGGIAFRQPITNQPLYTAMENGTPGLTYAVLAENAEGVRAVLAIDDLSGGSYYVAAIDVPCDRLGEYLNGPLVESDEPIQTITAHGDTYCRIPVMTFFQYRRF